MEEAGLLCESNWEEAAGSLESCVIFKPEIYQAEQKEAIAAPGFVLLADSQGSGPCQITFKFTQRPYKVRSIYLRSTAQVYKIYTMPELNGDSEYICTVHGEVTNWRGDSKYVEERTSRSEACPLSWASSTDKPSKSSVSLTEVGTRLFQKVEEHYRDMVDGQNLVGVAEKNKDDSQRIMSQTDDVHFPEDITKNEPNSSDEDSWVEVKLFDSLVMDSPCEVGHASRFHSSNDKKDVGVVLEPQCEISSEDDCGEIKHLVDKNGYESISIKDKCMHLTEEKIVVVRASGSCSEAKSRDAEPTENDKSIPLCRDKLRHEKTFYEATVEMVNAKPCMSLTIRLLSLKDTCSVEIEEMCIYAVPVVEIRAGMELMGPSSCFIPLGSSVVVSLLAMLVLSILQISRDRLSNRQDVLLSCRFNDSEEKELECGSSPSESSSTAFQPLTNAPALMEDWCSGKSLSTELLLYQKKPSHSLSSSDSAPDEIGENFEVSEHNLSIGETILSSKCKIDEMCGKEQQGEIGIACSELHQIEHVAEELAQGMADTEMRNSVRGCGTREVELMKINKIDEGLPEEKHGDTTLGHLVQRIERLEDWCMQIEVKVLEALENMEGRIRLLESQQMPSKPPVSTVAEGLNPFPGLYPLTNFSSVTSGPGIITNKCRHDSVLEAPSQLLSEFPSSVSMSNISSVSFPDYSSVIVTSKSSIPSSIDGLHSVHFSCPITSMDSAPRGTCALIESSVKFEESLKPDLHESSLDVFLCEETSAGLDLPHLSKGRKASRQSKDSHNAQCATEGMAKGAGDSVTFYDSLDTTKKPRISIDEALASALSAFSASIGPREENSCMHMEVPSGSSEVENTDDEEICHCDGLASDSSEEIRYRSQESMDSVPYSFSSQDSQDARYTSNGEHKFGSYKAGDSIHNMQASKPDIEMMIKLHKEVMPLEGKTEYRMLNSGIVMPEGKHDPRQICPKMTAYGQEYNLFQPFQKQYQLLGDSVSSKQCPENGNLTTEMSHSLIADWSSVFGPVYDISGKFGSDLSDMKGTFGCSNVESMQTEMITESAGCRQHDDAMNNLHISSASFFDVTFTKYDTYQAGMPLEALLCDRTLEQDGKTAGFQECSGSKCRVNARAPKRPSLPFFVEDEDLGDFIIPSPSTLPCSVTSGNFGAPQGMVPGMSPGFESLL